jgi:chloramphenicol 3-O-phosphotransferase
VEAFLITGVPGAGKSTTSREFARTIARSVHIEGDVLSFQFVVNGLASPFGERSDPDEWDRQMTLRRRNMCLLADSFAEAEFVPILDDVVTDQRSLDLHLDFLKTRPLHLIVLAPSVESAAARDAGRDKQVFEVWRHLDAEMRANLAGFGLWIDTTDLTIDQVIQVIQSRTDEALIA